MAANTSSFFNIPQLITNSDESEEHDRDEESILQRLRHTCGTRANDTQDYLNIIWNVSTFFIFVFLKFLTEDFTLITRLIGGFMLVFYADYKFQRCVRKNENPSVLIRLRAIAMSAVFCYSSSNHIFTVDNYSLKQVILLKKCDMAVESFVGTIKTIFLSIYFIKLFTILMKSLIFAMPTGCLTQTSKSQFYQLSEFLSQTFCSFIITVQWIHYFKGSWLIDEEIIINWKKLCLIIGYSIFKIKIVVGQLITVARCLGNLTEYRIQPTAEEIEKAELCPICCDQFRKPQKLKCNHVFCTKCIDSWFEKTRTCPVCRIYSPLTNSTKYSDGTTSKIIEFW
ncbi:unnamed protein product [Auanema sp. JU1783]|nr:unnamed protein product [Auanema sp. JU1783]